MDVLSIWSQYRDALHAFLSSKVANAADAEDLLQEVLIRTYRGFDQLNDETSLKAWLFSIANNAVIDFYRKAGRAPDLRQEMLWFTDDAATVQSELTNCIEPFLGAMSRDQAELLRAVALNGQSQKALAHELNIPYSTLKSKVAAARRELRDLFNGCCRYQLDTQGNLIDFTPKNGGGSCTNC